jgi:hypothetical protein
MKIDDYEATDIRVLYEFRSHTTEYVYSGSEDSRLCSRDIWFESQPGKVIILRISVTDSMRILC